jgi:hypothetical protein
VICGCWRRDAKANTPDASAAPCRLSDRVPIVDDEFLIVVELFMRVEDSRHATTAPFMPVFEWPLRTAIQSARNESINRRPLPRDHVCQAYLFA